MIDSDSCIGRTAAAYQSYKVAIFFFLINTEYSDDVKFII